MASWLENHHEPYHIQKGIVGSLNYFKTRLTDDDCDLLLFWVLALEYMMSTAMNSRFRREYQNITELLEYFQTVLEDIKKSIQKVIDINKKTSELKKQTKTKLKKAKVAKPTKSSFPINIVMHT